jgi:hypothetical protein
MLDALTTCMPTTDTHLDLQLPGYCSFIDVIDPYLTLTNALLSTRAPLRSQMFNFLQVIPFIPSIVSSDISAQTQGLATFSRTPFQIGDIDSPCT